MKTRIFPALLIAIWAPVLVIGAEFPKPYDSGTPQTGLMSATEAASKMQLPSALKATAFAAEPDVCNPIAMSWDNRGRLWVAENYTYAEGGVRYDLNLHDRILIFEDTKGDGHFSSRRVFCDDVQMLTSIEVGHGGVWALCLPYLVFIPDKDNRGIPDGPPQVVLDGFNPPLENYHNVASGLRFGPDGWLYGRCGASGPADVGAPGTPPEQRVPVRGGMWRYHPQRKIFEAICSGNTNPWGHDWNEHGELFYVNTVNGHLWHAVAGMHFDRPHTIDPNPHAYELIQMCADHWHFDTGKGWGSSRNGGALSLGGGHSHIGTMIYLGDNWPDEFRGHLFTLNQHGHRANQELLERSGSGYVAHHGTDTLIQADPWFLGLDLAYGPDGGVFVLDWNNTGECHGRNGIQRSTGRIYKITAGSPKPANVDLSKCDVPELLKLLTHKNEWFAREARLELSSRKIDFASVRPQLMAMFQKESDVVVKLRAMWALYTLSGADETFLRSQLHHPDEHIRTWAVRLICDSWPLDTLMSVRPTWQSGFAEAEKESAKWQDDLLRLAREDSSGLVRLVVASALQRLPLKSRAPVAVALAAHKEDASDHNLPLMIWYALIPVADADPMALVPVASTCEMPVTRRLIARRLTEDVERNSAPISALIAFALAGPNEYSRDLLDGMSEALVGWRKAPKPPAWEALVSKVASAHDATLDAKVRELSVVFGDGRALDEVKRVAMDNNADLNQRKAALQTLIDSRPSDLRATCEKLLSVRFLNTVAARGLSSFDDPAIGPKLASSYKQFHQSERGQILGVLVSRPAFASALLDAVAAGKISRNDLTPFHARQIRGLNDPELNKKLAQVWGELREVAADKKQFMEKLRLQLTPPVLASADKSAGRVVFNTTCAACHRLYGQGGEIGPDLTGSGRANLDYLLDNIVDPSAVVPADFRMVIVKMKDGRVLNGIVAAKTAKTITLKSPTEKVTVDVADIAKMVESPQSLMPEGLLEALSPTQVRDLLAYLMYPSQVP